MVAKKRRRKVVMVVDIGTSAIRATIAEIVRRKPRVLDQLTAPVDLSVTLHGGLLDRDLMDQVEEILLRMKEMADGYGVNAMRIVGTTTLREAINSDVLVENIQTTHGISIDIIDAAEEARLYYEGLLAHMKEHDYKLSGNSLLLDIGGGATSTALIRKNSLLYAADEPFGTVRALELFRGLRDRADFTNSLNRYVHGAMRMIVRRLPQRKIKTVLVNGPEIRQVVAYMGKDQSAAFVVLPRADIEHWVTQIEKMSVAECAATWQVSDEQVLQVVPAAYMLLHLAREVGEGDLINPQINLRDGLLADMTPGSHGPQFLGRTDLLATARQLASRYGMDLAYADNTAALAGQIFDQTVNLHHLEERERTLLEFAALVHDIGAFVNVHNRHLHTRYILENAVIAGLTTMEKKVIAHVARYHRRDHPAVDHHEFHVLPRRIRVLIRSLAAILRLAYALDVERTQRIRRVKCEVRDRRLLVYVDRRQISLERWSVDARCDMIREVFGLEVTVVPREEE